MTGSSHSLAQKKLPGYLLHKATGQARVRINGNDHYLGPFGSEQSRVAYGNLIAKHASGVPIDPFRSSSSDSDDPGLTINELVLAFMKHADGHYLKNGVATSEIACIILRAARNEVLARRWCFGMMGVGV